MNQDTTIFCRDFINNHFMAVGACVSNGEPRAFTFWYIVYNNKMYWKSRTNSIHCQAFLSQPVMSVCIYDHGATYPDDKTGVQIVGTVAQVTDRDEMKNVVEQFANKFGEKVYQKNNIDELCDKNTSSTFYSFTPHQIKLVSKELDIHFEEYKDFTLL